MLQGIVNSIRRLIHQVVYAFLRYSHFFILLLFIGLIYVPLILYLQYPSLWDRLELELSDFILVILCATLILLFVLERHDILRGIVNSIRLVRQTLRAFFRYPKLVIPLLFSWLIYAPLILYLKYSFPWDQLEFSGFVLVICCIITILSFVLSMSCLTLLEMMQQIESGQRISIWRAFIDAAYRDLPKALPIIFIWAVIWTILTIIFAFLSRRKKHKDEERSLTLESAVRTLSGGGNRFSFNRAFIHSLNKSLRMSVFLIFPSIAWENLGPRQATRRGMRALSTHLSEFASGFVLSEFAALAVFLPPLILLWSADTYGLKFSAQVWATVLIYCAFAWSFSMFIVQMFAGELYLWHLKWEKAGKPGLKNKKRVNKLECVDKPSILDKVPEFV